MDQPRRRLKRRAAGGRAFPTHFPLAPLLADGRWHSGEALGGALGVGRAMVWKQMRALRALGVLVEGRRGRGYRVAAGLDLLSAERIREQLSAEAMPDELLILDSVDSTNRVAAEHLRASGLAACVCLAEHQRAGRGRMGRHWVSPFAANIYLSAARRCDCGVDALEGLGLAVGVAVAECVMALGPSVGLKWPNDIVSAQRKLAGVLLEVAGEWNGQCTVVVGVGLNVRMSEAMAGGIDQAWTALERLSPMALSRNALCADLINRLLPLLASYPEQGLAGYHARWEALDALRGEAVVVRVGDRQLAGVARGIDARGALLLDTDAGRQAVNSGEASLRLS